MKCRWLLVKTDMSAQYNTQRSVTKKAVKMCQAQNTYSGSVLFAYNNNYRRHARFT